MSDIAQQVQQLRPWFHNLHLPDGTQTCPDHTLGDFPHFKWQQLAPHIPSDLRGVRALDIGCNAGFYTLELARRGADVVALDSDEHYLAQAKWAAELYGLSHRVRFTKKSVYELARCQERWDLVLFLGVFYHLRYPVLGLDIVSRCVGGRLILQSLSAPEENVVDPPRELGLEDRGRLLEPGWPRLSFVEHRLADDPTNWWVPNRACVEALLRSCGMRVLSRPDAELYICEPDPGSESNMWSWNEEEYRAAVGWDHGTSPGQKGTLP